MYMKKIFLKYNWVTPVFIIASFLLSSCLKDSGFDDREYQLVTGPGTEGSEYVSIPLAAKKPNPLGLEAKAGFQTVELFKASYDYQSPASADITVVMERNDALVQPMDPTAELIPATEVTVPTMDLVIPAGKFASDDFFKISINTGNLNPLKKYGIGFTLKSVSKTGVAIPENLKNVVFVFPIKNKYDGQYKVNIETIGWAAYGIASGTPGNLPANIGFVTSDVDKVTTSNYSRSGDALQPAFTTDNGSATAFGATSPEFIFNTTTNKLIDVRNTTPDDGRGRAFKINPAAGADDNNYDPATKKIYANYLMLQNGRPDQTIKLICTFDKPR
jgi:hypothetical protein